MKNPQVPDLNPPSDGELIAAVRGGDQHAYGQLFERHRDAALRLARQLAGSSDAEDLVSDAFVKVFKVLSAGGGPDLAFRAYLLTAVRRLHVDRIRRVSKVTPTDELETFDPGVPFADPAVQEFENVAASKAFASLPERWQLVLWHIEVEGQKPAEVAVLLGMSANSVSALAYRAREGLRQAYLQMHMADTAAEECRWVTERLGARVRNGLSRRDTAKVDEHLDECARCSAVYLELTEVNSNLSGILAPILLGAAATGYLTSGGASATGVASVLLKARHFLKAHGAISGLSTAASVLTVGVATAVIIHSGGGPRRDTASDVPRPLVPAATSTSTTSSPAHTSSPPHSKGPSKPAKSDPSKPAGTTPGKQAPDTQIPGLTVPTGTTSPPQVLLPTTPAGAPTSPVSVPPDDSGPGSPPASIGTTTPPGGSSSSSSTSAATSTSSTSTSTTTTTTTEPTETTTTTETPTPPTLSMGIRDAAWRDREFLGFSWFTLTADVSSEGDTGTITLVVDAQDGLLFDPTHADWECVPTRWRLWPLLVDRFSCTTSSDQPQPLTVQGALDRKGGFVSLTATADNVEGELTDSWPSGRAD